MNTFAQEKKSTEPLPELPYMERAEGFREYVSSNWKGMVGGVDNFFGTEEFEEEINDTYIRFNYIIKRSEGKNESAEFNFRLRAKFPKISKKVDLVFQKENETDSPQELDFLSEGSEDSTSVSDSANTLNDSTYSAAARLILQASEKWNVQTDLGMKVDLPLDPFVKLRIRRSWVPEEKSEIQFIQNFDLFRIDSLFTTSTLLFSRDTGGGDKIELRNNLYWSDDSDEFTGNNFITYYQKLSERRALSYSVGGSFVTKEANYYTEYGTSVSFRQLIHKDWLYLQYSGGFNFPKDEGFDIKPNSTIVFEAFF